MDGIADAFIHHTLMHCAFNHLSHGGPSPFCLDDPHILILLNTFMKQ